MNPTWHQNTIFSTGQYLIQIFYASTSLVGHYAFKSGCVIDYSLLANAFKLLRINEKNETF